MNAPLHMTLLGGPLDGQRLPLPPMPAPERISIPLAVDTLSLALPLVGGGSMPLEVREPADCPGRAVGRVIYHLWSDGRYHAQPEPPCAGV